MTDCDAYPNTALPHIPEHLTCMCALSGYRRTHPHHRQFPLQSLKMCGSLHNLQRHFRPPFTQDLNWHRGNPACQCLGSYFRWGSRRAMGVCMYRDIFVTKPIYLTHLLTHRVLQLFTRFKLKKCWCYLVMGSLLLWV